MLIWQILVKIAYTRRGVNSSKNEYYFNEQDSNGGSNPDNIFPLFLKKTADLFSPKLPKFSMLS